MEGRAREQGDCAGEGGFHLLLTLLASLSPPSALLFYSWGGNEDEEEKRCAVRSYSGQDDLARLATSTPSASRPNHLASARFVRARPTLA